MPCESPREEFPTKGPAMPYESPREEFPTEGPAMPYESPTGGFPTEGPAMPCESPTGEFPTGGPATPCESPKMEEDTWEAPPAIPLEIPTEAGPGVSPPADLHVVAPEDPKAANPPGVTPHAMVETPALENLHLAVLLEGPRAPRPSRRLPPLWEYARPTSEPAPEAAVRRLRDQPAAALRASRAPWRTSTEATGSRALESPPAPVLAAEEAPPRPPRH